MSARPAAARHQAARCSPCREGAVHALDRAGLRVAAAGLDGVDRVARRRRGSCPSCSGSRPVCSCSTKRIRSTPGRISAAEEVRRRAESTSTVVAVPALTTRQARPGSQRARRDQRRPAVGAELLGPLVAAASRRSARRSPCSHSGSASKMLVQLTSSWCAPSPATLEMTMRSGFVVRRRERVDVVARGGELDQRHGGDARPAAAAVVPAPLDARIAGVDGEDHAGLAETTRPLRTVAHAAARAQAQRAVWARGRRRCRSRCARRRGARAGAGRRARAARASRRANARRSPRARRPRSAASTSRADRGDDRVALGRRAHQLVERGDAAAQARAESRAPAAVDADADHGEHARRPATRVSTRMPPSFAPHAAADQQVVRPLERDLARRRARAARAPRRRRRERQPGELARRAAQRRSEREGRRRRRAPTVPAPAAPAAARGLLVRGEQHRLARHRSASSSALVEVQRSSTRTSSAGTRICACRRAGPCRSLRGCAKAKSRPGAASNSARVYSWLRRGEDLRRGAVLDHAALRHHRDVVADLRRDAQVVRDEQHRQVAGASRISSSSASTCACTETSSADTASSAISSSGSMASARAMQMRWRWPPENWCG